MRRSIIALSLLVFASSAGAQATPPASNTPPRLTQEQATQQNLVRLEELWAIALMRRDRSAFERTLAPRFVYTLNDRMQYRADYLAALLAPSDLITDARVDSVEVQAAGNIGIATGWRTISGRGSDGPFERRYRFTNTWMPRSGTWQLLSAHDYLPVPPAVPK